jgi:hypothetical protein
LDSQKELENSMSHVAIDGAIFNSPFDEWKRYLIFSGDMVVNQQAEGARTSQYLALPFLESVAP